MRKFRCLSCKHEFEAAPNVVPAHCPKCFNRYVELIEGPAIKGKSWGSKSYSVAPRKG
ncbi:MAG: hydrogenase expression protein HypA/HybF [Synergistaceae bacterium]|jgi:Zn finger protein HypA/HybF involved in hydrogenase expression|nr:hydrogenase expression protein HypA/HybF [Synergistaceae bacterium]